METISTLSDYMPSRHARREAGIQFPGVYALSYPWNPAVELFNLFSRNVRLYCHFGHRVDCNNFREISTVVKGLIRVVAETGSSSNLQRRPDDTLA